MKANSGLKELSDINGARLLDVKHLKKVRVCYVELNESLKAVEKGKKSVIA